MRFLFKQFVVWAIIIVGLIMFIALTVIIGRRDGTFLRTPNVYTSIYQEVRGIYVGSEVTIHGARTGNIIRTTLLKDGTIEVTFTVKNNHVFMINQSSVTQLKTQGALGDRYINIITDDLSAPPIPINGRIRTTSSFDLGTDLAVILKSLSSILKKIDSGDGSLGAVINNRNLYNRLLTIMGERPRYNYLKDLSKKSKKKK